MRVGEGRQKGRRDHSLRCGHGAPLLSASNDSLDDMAREVRVEVDDALRGRLIDVPLLRGLVGAFECLHGYRDHASSAPSCSASPARVTGWRPLPSWRGWCVGSSETRRGCSPGCARAGRNI